MALNLESKKAIVAEVSDVAASALSVVAADYRGLSVSDMNDLRVKAREAGVYLRVVRNTLARRAVVGTQFECMKDVLLGPIVLAFAQDEPGAAARLFKDFMKTCNKLEVTALAIDGKALPGDQLDVLAKLPTRDQALAMLLNVMNAPITKFVRTLAEPHTQVVRAFAAVRDQKQN